MAQRLCFGERSRIEAMREAQLSVDEIAERLGRHRSTVYRELDRGGGLDGYCARTTHRRAVDTAARPNLLLPKRGKLYRAWVELGG